MKIICCPYCGKKMAINKKTICKQCSIKIEVNDKETSIDEAQKMIIICKK